jgi:FkbM family methyltransferase
MNIEFNKQTIEIAYALLLGRPPENEQAIEHHLKLGSLEKLRAAMTASPEFKSKVLHSNFADSKWVAADVLSRYTMWIDLHDKYVSHGCLNNSWEPEETSFFESRLRSGDVVLDIGANIGWFSLVAAKHIGSSGKVHAFEPRPETAKMLKRTVAQNSLNSTINVWEYALSDKAEELNLSWGNNTVNPGGSFISGSADNSAPIAGHVSQKIFACKLDDLLPDVAPNIIKIDVEGAEPRALMGAKNAIARKKPVILSELFPEQLKRVSGKTPVAFISQMEDMGYQCFWLQKGLPTKRLKDFPSESKRQLESVIFEWRG